MAKPNVKHGYIYALKAGGKVFYIGQTVRCNLQKRLSEHVYDASHRPQKNIFKSRKIRKLIREGIDIEISLLQKVAISQLNQAEKRCISFYRNKNVLTNNTDGGDFNPLSHNSFDKITEIKKKISNTQRRRQKEKIVSLGYTNEQYAVYILQVNRIRSRQWRKANKEKVLESARRHRKKVRDCLGENEYKKKIAKAKRVWMLGLSDEQKEARRAKECIYRKRKRQERNSIVKI